MDTYLQNLFNQFLSVTGMDNTIDVSENVLNNFHKWLVDMQFLGQKYEEILTLMKVDFNTSKIAEIGKGKYDSIVHGNGKTTIITPCPNEFFDIISNPIIIGSLECLGNEPVIVETDMVETTYTTLSNFNIDTIMTHNPFGDINTFLRLCNRTYLNIVVGVFGKIYDKNAEQKIEMLKEFKRKIIAPVDLRFFQLGDNYYEVVKTEKNKEKVKH